MTAGASSIDQLSAGTYSILITDQNNCTADCMLTLIDPPCNMQLNALSTPPSCAGSRNGRIRITVTDGQAPFLFDWNVDSLDNGFDFDDLSPGNYSLTVTDNQNCMEVIDVNLPEVDTLRLSCSVVRNNTEIGGAAGQAQISFEGGTAPYEISWTGPVSGSSTPGSPLGLLVPMLPAGVYQVNLRDANGCTNNCSFTITEPDCSAFSISISGTNLSCNGSADGQINLLINDMANGQPHTVDWNINALDGQTDIFDLPAGAYFVEVNNAKNCILRDTILLEEPLPLDLSCGTIPDSTGLAEIRFDGGTAPYNLSWTGPQSGNQTAPEPDSIRLRNLPEGAYNISLTDANGCTQNCRFTILPTDCNAFSISLTSEEPSCNGARDGQIDLIITDDPSSQPHQINWEPAEFNGQTNLRDLPAGTYILEVSNAKGCNLRDTLILGEPTPLELLCNSNTGFPDLAQINFAGGTPPYTLNWNGPLSGSETFALADVFLIWELTPGDYSVQLEDAKGCSQSCNFNIAEPDCTGFRIDLSSQPISCAGGSDGAIQLTITDDPSDQDFGIDWNNDLFDDLDSLQDLGPGKYIVSVSNTKGCILTDSIELVAPAPLELSCGPIPGVSGEAGIRFGGGTAPYSLNWTGPISGSQSGLTADSITLTDLPVGAYNVLLEDANGCTESCDFNVPEPSCSNFIIQFNSQPISCAGGNDGLIELLIEDQPSVQNFTIDWNMDQFDGVRNLQGLEAGTYIVTVTNAQSCVLTDSIELIEPIPLELMCGPIADSVGQANIRFGGGTAPLFP